MWSIVSAANQCLYVGLSTDDKGDAPDGHGFIELDTGKIFKANGASWVVTNGGGAASSEAFPVGSIYTNVTGTSPTVELGYGVWTAFGAGKVIVGQNVLDADFNTAEETGGAKTVASAGTVAAPTISGSTANESAHTHSVTSNVAVGDHASHTHNYTQVPNHVHGFTDLRGLATGSATTSRAVTEGNDTSSTATGLKTANPDGGVATATTAGPNATLTHAVTNNAVTSGAGSAHNHGVGTLAASAPAFTGTATSVVQPYIVAYFWKRTL